ncbi:DUF2142 domain-containing protein [Nocardioides houyundeii]|uniref:DUF2142 domain-containing protein n=1 Tax=Nocardioides houyundeii TaxID=2045452 RepID=UPI000C760A00|nr:DUF2142 domain-containing protein [Nocardioides houyundeii]
MPEADRPRHPWTRTRLLVTTLVAWVWVFGCFMAWSVATPLWSTPDAPAHDLMAWHVGHGNLEPELTDVFASGVTSNAVMDVPEGLVQSASSFSCMVFQPEVPASCMTFPTDSETLVEFTNPAGRNMPTYYLATGWPSNLVPQQYAVYAERVAAAALAALFVAFAISAALTMRRPGVALTGVGLTLTPMVMYLGGAVNPNITEITAGIALAACGLAFWRDPDSWLGAAMFRRAMLAATVMVTIRMLAPFWVLIWAAAFVALARRRTWRAVLTRRNLPWAFLPAAGAVFDLWWTNHAELLSIQAEDKFDLSWPQRLMEAKQWIDSTTLVQQVGSFGWLELTLPPEQFTVIAWTTIFVLSTALVLLTRREVLVVVALGLATYAAPILLQAYQWNTTGGVWQGRYTLPVTVMVPVFALFLASERLDGDRAWLRRRLGIAWSVAIAILAVGQLRAFLHLLRRNVSGTEGDSLFDGPWDPPLPGELLTAVLAALLAAAWAGHLLALRRSATPIPDDVPAVAPSR